MKKFLIAIVILAIIGLIFLFGSYAIAVGPVLMAVALMFLELFVAFLQAYIFALLTSVFIGLIRLMKTNRAAPATGPAAGIGSAGSWI